MSFAQLSTTTDATPYIWSLVLSAGMVILSIAPLYVARFKSQFEMGDLASLRSMFDRYPDWGKRASWAQQNSFESFTLHAPAALFSVVAVLNGQAFPSLAVAAAIAHPIFRAIYVVAYITNIPPLRSLCWALGLLCTGILYGLCFSIMR